MRLALMVHFTSYANWCEYKLLDAKNNVCVPTLFTSEIHNRTVSKIKGQNY